MSYLRIVEHTAVASYPCGYCSAKPGQRCRTQSGSLTQAHHVRTQGVLYANQTGWAEGINDEATSSRSRHAPPCERCGEVRA